MATAASPIASARTADTAGLEVALVERALSDAGLLFSRAGPGFQCFYRLTIQPTLFGGVDLVREWGRLAPTPAPSRRLVEAYPGPTEVLRPLAAAVRVRLRHGYRARALPARFVPSGPVVHWCPAILRDAGGRDG
jgi:hypothetical protein